MNSGSIFLGQGETNSRQTTREDLCGVKLEGWTVREREMERNVLDAGRKQYTSISVTSLSGQFRFEVSSVYPDVMWNLLQL